MATLYGFEPIARRGKLFEFATHHSHAVSDLSRTRHREVTDCRVTPADRTDVPGRDLEIATDTFTRFLGMKAEPAEPIALDAAGAIEM